MRCLLQVPRRSTWVGRSVIRTCGKLAYPMVQSMIEGKYLARPGEEPPCQLNGDHTWPEVCFVGWSLAYCCEEVP